MKNHSAFPFFKFHGAGNDFIIVDNREGQSFSSAQIRQWCNRRTGIGADGFILLEDDSAGADFNMRYYNADGAEASLCGNGSRCVVAFAHYLGIITKQTIFNAFDGKHAAEVVKVGAEEWQVLLKMNDDIPITCWEDGYFIDTGSPHFVKFVDDIDQVDILNEGKKTRHDSRFPEGCNANFVKINDDHIVVRTYERGVEDETLSCGTGVTAAALALALRENDPDGAHTVSIKTKGGDLRVKFTKYPDHFSDLYLEGPAVLVFAGEKIVIND